MVKYVHDLWLLSDSPSLLADKGWLLSDSLSLLSTCHFFAIEIKHKVTKLSPNSHGKVILDR